MHVATTVLFPSLLGRNAHAVTRRRFWPYSSAGKSWTSVTRTRLSPGICALKSACDGDVYAVHRHASMRTFAHDAHKQPRKHTGNPLFFIEPGTRCHKSAGMRWQAWASISRNSPSSASVPLPRSPPSPNAAHGGGVASSNYASFFFSFFHYDLCLGIGSSSAWRRGGLRQLRELF